ILPQRPYRDGFSRMLERDASPRPHLVVYRIPILIRPGPLTAFEKGNLTRWPDDPQLEFHAALVFGFFPGRPAAISAKVRLLRTDRSSSGFSISQEASAYSSRCLMTSQRFRCDAF